MKHFAFNIFIFGILIIVLCTDIYSQDLGKEPKQSKKTINMNDPINFKSDSEWEKTLTKEQYYVMRKKGTERAYTGKLLYNREEGTYFCAGCGTKLFSSHNKFDSDCGWPSFDNAIDSNKIITEKDTSHGMVRTEIMCAKCGGHLGHVFNDGPTETGLRYCVNSVSIGFEPSQKTIDTLEVATLGGGCFWCIEAAFNKLEGVLKVESGYSGGRTQNPTYKEVCSGITGHAEVVQITYNSSKVSFQDILKVFFIIHDPTTLNKQGADIGTQYRSVIFYHNDRQKIIAESIIEALEKEKIFSKRIVTEISPFTIFYKAEDYHQNYYVNNQQQPYCLYVVKPKVDKFEKIFKNKLKKP